MNSVTSSSFTSALGPCLRPEFGYNCQSPLTLLSVLSPCLSSAKLTARDLSKPPGYIQVGSPNWPLTVLSNNWLPMRPQQLSSTATDLMTDSYYCRCQIASRQPHLLLTSSVSLSLSLSPSLIVSTN